MSNDYRTRRPESVASWPIITGDLYNRVAARKEDYAAEETFFSSGSSGDPDVIRYSKHDADLLATTAGELYATGGLTEDDVVLNLGAPAAKQHMSGWIFTVGAEEVGAELVNSCVDDYEAVIENGDNERVTAVMSIPLMMQSIGEQIEEEYGAVTDIFPNMEKGFSGGDTLTDTIRDTLHEQWGFDYIRDLYATTEFGIAAIEKDTSGGMVPHTDSMVFEIIDEDEYATLHEDNSRSDLYEEFDPTTIPEDIVHNISDLGVGEQRSGPLLTSQPREYLPPVRVKLGDIFSAKGTSGGPRLTFQEREKNTLSMAGAPLQGREIYHALQALYDVSANDWGAVASRPDYHALDVYVVADHEHSSEDFTDQLYRIKPAVETAVERDTVDYIHLHTYPSVKEIEVELEQFDLDRDLFADGVKSANVARDISYFE